MVVELETKLPVGLFGDAGDVAERDDVAGFTGRY